LIFTSRRVIDSCFTSLLTLDPPTGGPRLTTARCIPLRRRRDGLAGDSWGRRRPLILDGPGRRPLAGNAVHSGRRRGFQRPLSRSLFSSTTVLTAGFFGIVDPTLSMLANQASSTPPITADSSDRMMQDGAGKLWISLGQSPGLKMALRRLPVFQSDIEKRCAAVMSLIVPAPDIVTNADEAKRRMTPQV